MLREQSLYAEMLHVHQVGDVLFLISKNNATVTNVRRVISPKTLAKVDPVLHEVFTPEQVTSYDEAHKRLAKEMKLKMKRMMKLLGNLKVKCCNQ